MGLFKKKKKEDEVLKKIEKVEVVQKKVDVNLGTKEGKKVSVKAVKVEEKTEEIKSLESLNKFKVENQTENALKDLNEAKDLTKANLPKLAGKLYEYWVMIMKNGRRVSSFGVNKEEYNGVDLLVKQVDQGGSVKVIFRELYPEPAFDLSEVKKNAQKYRQALNNLKQIEGKLVDNIFLAEPVEYNFDLADVRLKIQEYEIKLNSIRYGVKFEYTNDVREDGVPVLIYDLENSGLRLRKYVKEKHLYTEASENKKIESFEAGQQIDRALKKKNEKDWMKIAITFMWIMILGIATYASFMWLQYNEERAFADAKEQFQSLVEAQNKGVSDMLQEIQKNHIGDDLFENQILEDQVKLMDYILGKETEGIAQR